MGMGIQVTPFQREKLKSPQEMFICLFADVPGELIFGSLVDASCTLWSSGGSCSSYNTTNLRIGLFGVAAMARYLAHTTENRNITFLLFAVAWLLCLTDSFGTG